MRANFRAEDVKSPERAYPSCMCLTYGIAIPINSTLSVAIDMDALSGDNKPCMVVLKSDWVGIISPVI